MSKNESDPPQDSSRPLDPEQDHDPLEDGLRAVFESEPALPTDEHRSVVQILGETLGVTRVCLKDAQEGWTPINRAHGKTVSLPPQVGKYRLAGEIARGGVGAVVRARDEDIGRDIALKVLLDKHDGNSQMTQRFVEEAQIGGQLQHPGIVPVHELGLIAQKKPFIAMKLVKGKTLSRLLQDRRDPAEDRQRFLGIFEQICQPLAYAHARGVIHRDLKPSNVMVGAFGEVQVMDWGLAKVLARGGTADEAVHNVSLIETLRSGSSNSASLAGSVIGTPAYMSPEQACGQTDDIDERSDVFGLGAILCEILTGKPPYTGETTQDIHRQAKKGYLDDALKRLDACGADPQVIGIAKQCLAFEAHQRPRDAGAVAQGISSYLESLEEKARAMHVRAAEAAAKAEAERKSRRLTLALAAGILLAVLVGGGGYAWVDAERREAQHATETERQRAALQAKAHFQREFARCETLAKQAQALGSGGGSLWIAASDAVETVDRLPKADIGSEDRKRFETLRQQVRRETRNHQIIDRLDGIRDQTSYPIIDNQYLEVFRDDVGANPFDLPAREVKKRILATGIASQLALALDDWALVRKSMSQPWRELAEIALDVHTTSWRLRMWDAIKDGSPEELRKVASSLADENAPTGFLCLLADSLMQADENLKVAELLLRHALFEDRASYRANYFLGRLLCDDRCPRYSEGLRYLLVAKSLRPDDYDSHLNVELRQALQKTGDTDRALETIAEGVRSYGQMVDLMPALAMLSDSEQEPSVEVLDLLRKSIEESLAKNANPVLWEFLGATLARRIRTDDTGDVLQAALRAAARADHDPYVLNMLGRVQYAAGRHADAIHSLELATVLDSAPFRWREQLAKYRDAAAGLVTYASIDDFLEHGNIVRTGDEWRYFKGTASPSPGMRWTSLDFDDAAWATGASSFGYGDEVQRTLLADMAGGYTSLFVRKEFEVARLEDVKRAVLRIMADDGFVAYLNGKRVGYARMNPDDIRYDAVAQREYTHFWVAQPDQYNITPFLKSGKNVLAICGTNRTLNDFDFWLAPSMQIEYAADSDGMRQRVADCREALGGDSPDLLAKYLDGRARQLGGDYVGAEAKYREVLASDRSRAEPFLRLLECLVELHGVEMADQLLREELAKGEHAPLVGLPPAKPSALPVEFDENAFTLTASPFQHIDPNIKHRSTTWEIRDANAASQTDFVVRMVSDSHLTSLALPSHRLRPNTTYRWRVSYQTSSGQSVASDEARFVTEDYHQEIVPFDLRKGFNRDVICNPGDPMNQMVDGLLYSLTEEGFDGTEIPNRTLRGLPHDRFVGIHQLGDYHRNNTIQVNRTTDQTIRIDVPPRRYLAIRFLVTGGWGDSTLPIHFEYADGSRQQYLLPCEDWLDNPRKGSNHGGSFGRGVVPILSDLEQVGIDRSIRSRASLFEISLDANPQKTLQAVVLHADQLTDLSGPRAQFNLFAVTGVSATAESN